MMIKLGKMQKQQHKSICSKPCRLDALLVAQGSEFGLKIEFLFFYKVLLKVLPGTYTHVYLYTRTLF
jgi:hypothetical protein